MQALMKKFLTWLLLIPGEKLIQVKSWRPWIGPYGIEWPEMLIDTRGGTRLSISPVWDRHRLREIFKPDKVSLCPKCGNLDVWGEKGKRVCLTCGAFECVP